jgi:hypothetical protein
VALDETDRYNSDHASSATYVSTMAASENTVDASNAKTEDKFAKALVAHEVSGFHKGIVLVSALLPIYTDTVVFKICYPDLQVAEMSR